MNILLLDNYDSFTYNLVHIVRELGYGVDVFRNDKIDISSAGRYEKIMLSPGPGLPGEAGIMKALIRTYGSSKSILGVCLGHQAIAEVFGASLYNLPMVMHGVTSRASVAIESERLFDGLPGRFEVAHYHSWAVDPQSISDELEITAVNDEGLVLALAHKTFDVRGVQFHPESVMTEHGLRMIKNWIEN